MEAAWVDWRESIFVMVAIAWWRMQCSLVPSTTLEDVEIRSRERGGHAFEGGQKTAAECHKTEVLNHPQRMAEGVMKVRYCVAAATKLFPMALKRKGVSCLATESIVRMAADGGGKSTEAVAT